MDRLANYIIVSMCVFSITYLLKYTDGPFDIFVRLRRLVKLEIPVYGAVYGGEKKIVGYEEDTEPESFFAKLFSCWWCLSTWLSIIVSGIYFGLVYISMKDIVFAWLFAIGLAGTIHEFIEKE